MAEGKILVVDDDPNQSGILRDILTFEGFEVHAVSSATQAIAAARKEPYQAILSDLRMPDMDGIELFRKIRELTPEVMFIIMTAHGTVDTTREALKEGIYDYILKPINSKELIATFERALEVARLKTENKTLKQKIEETKLEDRVIYASKKMAEVMELTKTVAKSEATVLIRGESGTGKEVIANALHGYSNRASGPYIKVNCAAIPENLLEDELFGHEKGAFTDAKGDRKGKFELAHGGTIFLDEIGDMPPQLQVKILRVLQERQFERIGGAKTFNVDVRLIAATNRDLEKLIGEGEFRQDLYYRLNVIPIVLPPLRERGDDVIKLAAHFLKKFNEKNGKSFKGFNADAQALLLNYSWPGNVRELENAIERAVVLGQGDEIRPEHLPAALKGHTRSNDDLIARLFESDLSLDDLEKELIQKALDRTSWNQSKAARLLGLTRRTLQYRVEKYNIRRPGEPAPPPSSIPPGGANGEEDDEDDET
ncbi:MAG TPA: sigma-54 dependent transcriptional regulator [Planctomycetota bacterium]|nr:sigma-54 dependent transcriptional regulator [Planctomycetota bacterium]